MAKEVVGLVVVGGIAVAALGLAALNGVHKLSKKTNSSQSSTRRDTARNTQPSGATITRRNTTTVQSNTTTDHQPATTTRRDTTTTRRDSDYKINPQNGGLLCNMECLLIGSFGDELAPGVKVIPKRFCKPIGPYLPGVKQDLETMNSKIEKDPSKTFAWSLVDYPEDQRPKEEYLQKIEEFLTQCETPGGEAFTQLM